MLFFVQKALWNAFLYYIVTNNQKEHQIWRHIIPLSAYTSNQILEKKTDKKLTYLEYFYNGNIVISGTTFLIYFLHKCPRPTIFVDIDDIEHKMTIDMEFWKMLDQLCRYWRYRSPLDDINIDIDIHWWSSKIHCSVDIDDILQKWRYRHRYMYRHY